MPDEPSVISIPNTNFFPGRDGLKPKYIILHGTAGGASAIAIAQYFASTQGTANPVSSHYVIGQDGMVAQCVNEADGAYGNGVLTPGHDDFWSMAINPNLITISIEHVKPSIDNSNLLTDAQKSASFALVKHICERHGIPKQRADANGGITGHYSLDPVSRAACPGPYPWQDLFSFLQSTVGVPKGWHDDGATLTAPNGVPVVKGFRSYILSNPSWDVNNWPLQPEEARNPLELSNPSLGTGTQQIFRYSALEWTAARGVFVAWIGQELLALRKLLQSKP